MRYFKKLFLLMFAVSSLSASDAFAKEGGHEFLGSNQENKWNNFENGSALSWLKRVDLTEEQQQKIDEIRNKAEGQIKIKRDEAVQAKKKLRGMLKGSSPDSEILGAFNKVQDIQRSIAEIFFKAILEIRSVLTPDQRNKLHQYVPKKLDEEGQEICKEDIAKFCPEKPIGHGLFRCLKENEGKLSAKCKEKIN